MMTVWLWLDLSGKKIGIPHLEPIITSKFDAFLRHHRSNLISHYTITINLSVRNIKQQTCPGPCHFHHRQLRQRLTSESKMSDSNPSSGSSVSAFLSSFIINGLIFLIFFVLFLIVIPLKECVDLCS